MINSLPYALSGKRVWVCGHNGMVGSAIVRRLKKEGDVEILTVERSEVDLVDQSSVNNWMIQNKPEAIFLAAAKVGGIHANSTYPADFIYLNTMISANVIHAAYKNEVEKILFLGSSCIYPKMAPQPIKEDALLTGPLEPTNQWYALAKISGIMMAQAYRAQYGSDYISAMPTNLYGPGDNFHLENSHVIPALMRKVHQAKNEGAASVTLWGSGEVYREFMHVDDCADALVFLMQNYSEDQFINIGQGSDIMIKSLLEDIMQVIGYQGQIEYDTTKPDGTPRKIMDNSRLESLGWTPHYNLLNGLEQTYQWFLKNEGQLRSR
ncbi:GDP-L-fucose synthase [Litorimonas haliclonae]|uniref:GDP-L-fucose synthase n=1 Tax=Litorimonas haliclonae TaxID=2081977 RepID=UPI0039F01596